MAIGRRGQIWSYDLIIASILFVIAMGILSFFWWSARTNLSENKDLVVQESVKVSDVLMSPGMPEGWNQLVNLSDQRTWAGVQQIGLADSWENTTISIDKIYKFRQMSLMNYSFVKSKLRSHYDFFADLVSINNSVESRVKLNGTELTSGKMYNELTTKTLAKIDRIVAYNNSVAVLRIYMWSDYIWD